MTHNSLTLLFHKYAANIKVYSKFGGEIKYGLLVFDTDWFQVLQPLLH